MMQIRHRLAALLLGLLALSAAAETTRVLMETSKGAITLELDSAKAPLTVANFLDYVDSGFYAGTVFHRVIPDFMIQGGGFEPGMRQKSTGEPVRNEAANGLTNQRGSIAMARTRDPHSATAQFFINLKHNDFLDHPGQDGWGYAVFGRVTDGIEVVDAIAGVKTATQGPHRDVPRDPVIIESVRRLP